MGLDKVLKNRDRHHQIRRQILRKNEGLILMFENPGGYHFGLLNRSFIISYNQYHQININNMSKHKYALDS